MQQSATISAGAVEEGDGTMVTGMLLALLAQALPPPGGVRWEVVIGEGERLLEVDPATIALEGGIVRYTVRLRTQGNPANGMQVMILRYAMNCSSRQIAILAGDGYAADGRLVSSRETAPGEIDYQDYPTGPDADRMHRRLCGGVTSQE